MIKDFYEKHHNWFSSFTSAFAGTLLGIGITFAIGAHSEQQKKEETAHKFLVMTINEIETNQNKLKSSVPEMRVTDSLFNELLSYYPDDLDEVPDSTALAMRGDLLFLTFQKCDNFAEKMFLNNIETLEVFDDLSIVSDICLLFKIMNQATDLKDKADNIKDSIIKKLCNKADLTTLTKDEFVETLFDAPETAINMNYYTLYTKGIVTLVDLTANKTKEIKTALGISKEDLETTQSERSKDVKEITQKL